ncbi:MAG TPA: hypothetical protein VFT78_06090 [Hanamia sp.]|nr:hypothetical protein [Hanamia sp.]
MTPRSLFNVILKIFGIFFLREIVLSVIQLISSLTVFIAPESFDDPSIRMGYVSVLIALIILAFYCFIVYKLMLKTNSIIDLLKLDRGFTQEEFLFNISMNRVLTIALIVLGGIILFEEVPNFFRNVYSWFQEKSFTRGTTTANYSNIITSAVKIVLALLMIGERNRIVKVFESKQEIEVEEGV